MNRQANANRFTANRLVNVTSSDNNVVITHSRNHINFDRRAEVVANSFIPGNSGILEKTPTKQQCKFNIHSPQFGNMRMRSCYHSSNPCEAGILHINVAKLDAKLKGKPLPERGIVPRACTPNHKRDCCPYSRNFGECVDVRCFNCGDRSHFVNECNLTPYKDREELKRRSRFHSAYPLAITAERCAFCNSFTHKMNQCLVLKNTSSCFRCRTNDHIGMNCPFNKLSEQFSEVNQYQIDRSLVANKVQIEPTRESYYVNYNRRVNNASPLASFIHENRSRSRSPIRTIGKFPTLNAAPSSRNNFGAVSKITSQNTASSSNIVNQKPATSSLRINPFTKLACNVKTPTKIYKGKRPNKIR